MSDSIKQEDFSNDDPARLTSVSDKNDATAGAGVTGDSSSRRSGGDGGGVTDSAVKVHSGIDTKTSASLSATAMPVRGVLSSSSRTPTAMSMGDSILNMLSDSRYVSLSESDKKLALGTLTQGFLGYEPGSATCVT